MIIVDKWKTEECHVQKGAYTQDLLNLLDPIIVQLYKGVTTVFVLGTSILKLTLPLTLIFEMDARKISRGFKFISSEDTP